jgi:thiol-disulfide isomerase/thioredoxin
MKRLMTMLAIFIGLIISQNGLAESYAFDSAKFDADFKAGKAILVAVHAPWCSTCRAQAPVLKEVLGKKAFQSVTLIHVDFDSQKQALKQLGVQRQSTLIVFKDGKEVARSLGDTSSLGIESLLQKII